MSITRLRDDWRVTVAVVSGGHFFSHFYLLVLPPLFPLFRSEFGLSNTELGLIISLLAIGGVLQAPVGNIVDRVGAKWVLVLGTAVTALGVTLIGISQTFPAILAFAILSGLGQSAFHPADYALIDTVTKPGIQGKAFSVHTFSGYAGFAAAPVVVGTLAYQWTWRSALVLVGIFGILYAAVAAFSLTSRYQQSPETVTQPDSDTGEERSFLFALKQPGIIAMVGFFIIMAFAGKGIQTFSTVLTVDSFGFAESVGSNLLTSFFAFGAIGVLVGGVLADRYAPERIISLTLLVGSTILAATVVGVLPLGPTQLIAVFGLIGFFLSLITPSRDQLVSNLAASGTMGQSFGVVFTGGTLGSLVGPVILGAVGDLQSVAAAFVLVSACYLLGGVLIHQTVSTTL